MNDNEIIKALECCCKGDKCVGHCPFHNNKHDIDICTSRLTKNALDLINRQKAEVEKLQNELKTTRQYIHENNLEYDLLVYSKRGSE